MGVRVVGTVVGLVVGAVLAIAWWEPPRRAIAVCAAVPLRVPRIGGPPVIRVPGPGDDDGGGAGRGGGPYTVSESGVSGRIRDLHNVPLAGVALRIVDRYAFSDSEGRFSLSLPAGSYTMSTRPNGTFHHTFTVSVGEFTVVDLVAADRKTIRITPAR